MSILRFEDAIPFEDNIEEAFEKTLKYTELVTERRLGSTHKTNREMCLLPSTR